MLEYVKDVKDKVEEIRKIDDVVMEKKKNLKQKIKQGDITRNQQNDLVNEILNLVYDKIEIYLDVCKIARKYEVFGLDKILGNSLHKYSASIDDYIDYSRGSLETIKKEINKDILNNFVKSNSPLTKYITYGSYVVNIDELLQKCTGVEWEISFIESPYIYQDIEDYEVYYEKSKYLLAVNKKYINSFKKVCLNKEKLEKLIMDKKCVLLRNIWCYENNKNNYNYLNQNLVFGLALDTQNNNVYERLYPNLRECFWDLLNDNTLQHIKDELNRHKNQIKYNEKQIVNIKKEIKESQEYINNYQKELDSQK